MEITEQQKIQLMQSGGWTIELIAKELNVSVETVKSWRYKGKTATAKHRTALLKLTNVK